MFGYSVRPFTGLAVRIAVQHTPTDEEEADTVVGVVLRTCGCHTVAEGRVCYFQGLRHVKRLCA